MSHKEQGSARERREIVAGRAFLGRGRVGSPVVKSRITIEMFVEGGHKFSASRSNYGFSLNKIRVNTDTGY